MKIVKENIDFKRGIDPKEAMKIGTRESLIRMGVEFDTTWDQTGEEDKKVTQNIEKIHETVMLLTKNDVKPEDISISRWNHFYVKVVRVMEGNAVKLECLSEEDGEKLIKVITDLSIENYSNWHLSYGTKLIYTDHIQDWLKNLKKNRAKYNKII